MLEDLFIEVPDNWMSDPVAVLTVGALSLRVVRQEVVLADRVIGFKHWRSTACGAQALSLMQALGASLDDRLLRERLREEDADDAYEALHALAGSATIVDEAELEALLPRLHERGETDDGSESR